MSTTLATPPSPSRVLLGGYPLDVASNAWTPSRVTATLPPSSDGQTGAVFGFRSGKTVDLVVEDDSGQPIDPIKVTFR